MVIRLDSPSDDDRELIVKSVRDWLLSAEVIRPFEEKPAARAEFARTDFSPGPRWRDAVDETVGAPFDELLLNGVDIRSGIDTCSAAGNSEPWTCERCGSAFEAFDLLESWASTHVEPSIECGSCGWSALLGDWTCEFPVLLVGGPMLEFHNWHALRPDFLGELTTRLGGQRSKYFWSHV